MQGYLPKSYAVNTVSLVQPSTSRELANELAIIAAEQAKAKATMDYKRSELNMLWNTASAEIKESLAANQKEWVNERDEICIAQAREAACQEIVRMECVTEIISERYYQLKEYIDTFDQA